MYFNNCKIVLKTYSLVIVRSIKIHTYTKSYAKAWRARGGVAGATIPPPPTHTLFLKSVSILTKCVGKISWPNVVGKFGVFYHKKRNAEFYQHPVP